MLRILANFFSTNFEHIDQEHVPSVFKLPRSASWACCSQSWMKPGFLQCLEILSKFLLILEHIDQEHVIRVFFQDQHLEHVAPHPG